PATHAAPPPDALPNLTGDGDQNTTLSDRLSTLDGHRGNHGVQPDSGGWRTDLLAFASHDSPAKHHRLRQHAQFRWDGDQGRLGWCRIGGRLFWRSKCGTKQNCPDDEDDHNA